MIEPAAQKPASLILVEEIAHRVRNEFAQAIAVIRLAAIHSSDSAARQTLDATARQLHAYANAHHILRELPPGAPYAVADYVEDICASIATSALANTGIRLTASVCDAFLPAERCWRLGLIVSELVRNAAHHGLRWKEGDIRVELKTDGNELRCSVSDSGGIEAAPEAGRGCRVVASLAGEIGGSVAWQFSARGTIAVVRLPFDEP